MIFQNVDYCDTTFITLPSGFDDSSEGMSLSPSGMIPDKALSPIIPAMRSSVFDNLDSEPPPPVADTFFLCAQIRFLASIFISNHFLLTSGMVLGTAETTLTASVTSFQAFDLPVPVTPLLIDENKMCFF